MKKDNFKKSAKIVKKIKPLAKGAVLQSIKENSLWLYGFAARMVKSLRQTALPYDDAVKRYEPRKRKPNNDKLGLRVFNLKRWHKLSAALVSIAIIGIVVFFQFAPENARSKTFAFFQTAWTAVVVSGILTANFSRAIIKLVNSPRATERSCGVFICSLYSYNNG